MHDGFGEEASQEEAEQAHGEAEASPVVTVLHDLEGVAFKVDRAIEVHLVERFYWDLVFAAVLGAVALAMEVEVVLHRLAGVPDLFILARRDARSNGPEHYEDR